MLSKNIFGCAAAFKLPGRCTKGKITALTRYCSLERLAALEDPADNLKLKFDISVSKTFEDDLTTARREFEEGAKKTSSAVPPMPEVEQLSQNSQLSNAPLDLLVPDNEIIKLDKESVSMSAKETVHLAGNTHKKDIRSSMAGGPLPAATESIASPGKHGIPTNVSARHLSSQGTCELHLSSDSLSPAYSSRLCI
jgi:hypothetical protein